MALDVDGYAVLGAIAAAPDAFPDIRADLAKTGRTLVAKQLKARGLTLAALRRVHQSLGGETFALVLDGMTEAETRSLVARLDKHHADLKTAPADWPRRHLADLAGGTEPAGKPSARVAPEKPPKPAGVAPKVTRALGSPAFAAIWDGQDHDRTEAPAKSGRGGKKTGGAKKKAG